MLTPAYSIISRGNIIFDLHVSYLWQLEHKTKAWCIPLCQLLVVISFKRFDDVTWVKV